MSYLDDNLNMHIICEGKMQYPCYDLNPMLGVHIFRLVSAIGILVTSSY